MKQEFYSNIPFTVGLGLLAIPAFALLISSLLFVCGASINPFIFPLSIVLAMAVMYVVSKNNIRQLLISVAMCIVIIAGSFLLASVFYDYTNDGNTYHQDIILQLKNGWNPIYEHHSPNAVWGQWVDHFGKGMETISATIYSITGAIELGKAINFILPISSIFLFFNFLSCFFPFLSVRKRVFLSILFCLCPVVVNQMFTFYIDGAIYTSLLILVITLISTVRNFSIFNCFIIGFIVLFSLSIKFNSFFWALFVIFCFLVYAMILRNAKLLQRVIFTSSIGALLGIFLVGFNPYITNTIDHQNPFYPLLGNGDVDFISFTTPPILKEKSREAAVMISLFAFPTTYDESPKFAFPSNLLKFAKEDIVPIGITNARLGGFGLFFSWILVLAGFLYFNKNTIRNKQRKKYNAVLLILFVSLFILPYSWWARYFPFFYAFPLIMLLYTECDKNA